MYSMFVTPEVSRGDRSIEASEEQPWNIHDISVTFEVFRPERPTEASEEQP